MTADLLLFYPSPPAATSSKLYRDIKNLANHQNKKHNNITIKSSPLHNPFNWKYWQIFRMKKLKSESDSAITVPTLGQTLSIIHAYQLARNI